MASLVDKNEGDGDDWGGMIGVIRQGQGRRQTNMVVIGSSQIRGSWSAIGERLVRSGT